MDALIAAAEAAADAAAVAIRPHFRRGITADTKSDDSPVTIADRSAEQAMRTVLQACCPDHGILGEEFGLQRPDARLRWVLDPVDGTRAFITGRPIFGTLVALLDGETPLLGLIDQPVTNERWIGAAGRPTVFRGAYGTAGCRPCPDLSQAELSCTAPEMFAGRTHVLDRLLAATHRVTWGGDCYGYGLLALGGIDVIVERGLKIWDWAAVIPVIEGAGGAVCDWQGGRPNPDGDGGVVAVGDARLLPQILPLLR